MSGVHHCFSGIFHRETCLQFLQFMGAYFRATLDKIHRLCAQTFRPEEPSFKMAFEQCIDSIRGWCEETRRNELVKLRAGVPYLEHMYEYTYYKAFHEFVKSKHHKAYPAYTPPADIQIVNFEDFFGVLIKKMCTDSRLRTSQALILGPLEFNALVVEHIRSVLCECMEYVTCTEDALNSYVVAPEDVEILSEERLRLHDSQAQEFILQQRTNNAGLRARKKRNVRASVPTGSPAASRRSSVSGHQVPQVPQVPEVPEVPDAPGSTGGGMPPEPEEMAPVISVPRMAKDPASSLHDITLLD